MDPLRRLFRFLSWDQTLTPVPTQEPLSIPNTIVRLREHYDGLVVEVWLLEGGMQSFIGKMTVSLPVIDSSIEVEYSNGMNRQSWRPLQES